MSSPVYFLPWKQIDKLPQWLEAIEATKYVMEQNYVAIKIHFGEDGNKGYIKDNFARMVSDQIKKRKAFPFLTDANTIYAGRRADAVNHLAVATKHGFTIQKCGCPVIIADGLRGNSGVDVEVNLKHFQKVSIANAIYNADTMIFMSHFKGHELSGFGGALKNIGMGCATKSGKYAMHDKAHPRVNKDNCSGCRNCIQWCSGHALEIVDGLINFIPEKCIGCGQCILSCSEKVFKIPWDETASGVQEKYIEYAFGAIKNKPSFYINFLNYITKFCDCYQTTADPILDNIGVMASDDPVALDQASIDMVNKVNKNDFCKSIFPEIDWTVQLAYAEKLGMGYRKYELVICAEL